MTRHKRPTPAVQYRRHALKQPIHNRIAALLGWRVEEARTFSLPMLRELLRKAPDQARARPLIAEIDQALESGTVVRCD